MAKLTNGQRLHIEVDLMRKFEEPRLKALDKQEHDLAVFAVETYFAELQEQLKSDSFHNGRHITSFTDYRVIFDNCPTEWFDTEESVRWRRKNGTGRGAELLKPTRLPVPLLRGTAILSSPELEARHKDQKTARLVFDRDRSTLWNKIRAVLYSVRTEDQLRKAWPEVSHYLSQKAQVTNLPVPSVGSINELLGLITVGIADTA